MMKSFSPLLIFFFLNVNNSFAKDIVLESKRQSNTVISRATVWKNKDPRRLTPAQVFQGPKRKKRYEALLDRSVVNCVTRPEDQDRGFGGVTPKFYCGLLDRNYNEVLKSSGKRRVIKVKYHQEDKPNNEVEGEILGTRLLWALGFYADRMYFVDRVNCYGCTKDPFKDRRVDADTFDTPQTFEGVAIEVKTSGDNFTTPHEVNGQTTYRDGFTLSDMVRHAPNMEQLAQRDALRLLSIFMNHVDAKAENQRMVCKDENKEGQCTKAILMVQDVGSTFGVSVPNFRIQKVNLDVWKNTPIWKNPSQCKAQFSKAVLPTAFIIAHDAGQNNPRISEGGRVFLADLLEKFSSNRERVVQLFKAARLEKRGDNINEWVEVFMQKVQEIRYPMGEDNEDFKCPQTRHERRVLRRG